MMQTWKTNIYDFSNKTILSNDIKSFYNLYYHLNNILGEMSVIEHTTSHLMSKHLHRFSLNLEEKMYLLWQASCSIFTYKY